MPRRQPLNANGPITSQTPAKDTTPLMEYVKMTNTRPSSPLKPVFLSSWGYSHTGTIRTENQDAYLNWPELKFWSVADGLGGTDHGAAASKLVTSSCMALKEPESLHDFILKTRLIIDDCNKLLYVQNRVGESSATTFVSLLMHANEAACLWAGDSRCYMLRNDVLFQCTTDHTLRQQKIDRGELTIPEAYRMVKGNIITNAIGGKERLKLDEVRFTLRAGDRFLLCSDGLSNMLDGKALARVLHYPSPKESADAIITTIADMPQPDNVTFVVVYISMRA